MPTIIFIIYLFIYFTIVIVYSTSDLHKHFSLQGLTLTPLPTFLSTFSFSPLSSPPIPPSPNPCLYQTPRNTLEVKRLQKEGDSAEKQDEAVDNSRGCDDRNLPVLCSAHSCTCLVEQEQTLARAGPLTAPMMTRGHLLMKQDNSSV